MKADPGAYSVYCNDGFTLAELVVEAVSGQDFMDYVREHILAPAGLDTSTPRRMRRMRSWRPFIPERTRVLCRRIV